MKVLRKIQSELRGIKLQLSAIFSSVKSHVKNNVPYVSQFAHPDFAEKILKDGADKTTDPEWQSTGAESPEEYAKWVLIICGMACTSMVLKYFKDKNVGTVFLAKDALKHSVYSQHLNDISDMQYREYAEWVKNYGLNAEVYSRLTIKGLKYLLSNEKFVIVSVNPNIRSYETADNKQKGGHLVLVTGYNQSDGTLTLHNPSGFVSHDTQENHTIPITQFKRYYARRGIAVSNIE